eukprot:scaffold11248_cov139-Isochrysis_galbana.AAC.1
MGAGASPRSTASVCLVMSDTSPPVLSVASAVHQEPVRFITGRCDALALKPSSAKSGLKKEKDGGRMGKGRGSVRTARDRGVPPSRR